MKKDSLEFHLIDFIYHTPKSDRTPTQFSSVHDKSITDALSIINEIEAGCFMAETDVKSALRIIPIHPSDYSMLGMKWQNPILIYRFLPMGCSSSCAIFEACITALEWLAMTCLELRAYYIF